MKRYEGFGKMLQELRSRKAQSITFVSKAVGIDRSHLSKLENGHERSSIDVLNSLIRHYSLSRDEASHLSSLSGYRQGIVVEEPGGRGKINMNNDNKLPNKDDIKPGLQVNLPNNLVVLYTDSVFVSTNNYGIVFDFAQSMGPTNQQNVIARLGMSKEHAKALLKVLADKLGENVGISPTKN